MIAEAAVSSSITKFSSTYLFLHFCFGTGRGQAHVACAWEQVPLITSHYAGSKSTLGGKIPVGGEGLAPLLHKKIGARGTGRRNV